MIYLQKGQVLSDNPSLVMYDPTGYYNDGDSVICASVSSPDEPVCRYEAKFVAYGGIVYSITDPDKLLEEVMKIDPASLFGKDSAQIATDKAVQQIQTVDTTATQQATNTQDTLVNNPPAQSAPATTTPADTSAPTSTPVTTDVPTVTSTSTPVTNTTTSTPSSLDAPTSTPTSLDSATSTPASGPTIAPSPTSSQTTTPDTILTPPAANTTATGTPVSIIKKRRRLIV